MQMTSHKLMVLITLLLPISVQAVEFHRPGYANGINNLEVSQVTLESSIAFQNDTVQPEFSLRYGFHRDYELRAQSGIFRNQKNSSGIDDLKLGILAPWKKSFSGHLQLTLPTGNSDIGAGTTGIMTELNFVLPTTLPFEFSGNLQLSLEKEYAKEWGPLIAGSTAANYQFSDSISSYGEIIAQFADSLSLSAAIGGIFQCNERAQLDLSFEFGLNNSDRAFIIGGSYLFLKKLRKLIDIVIFYYSVTAQYENKAQSIPSFWFIKHC